MVHKFIFPQDDAMIIQSQLQAEQIDQSLEISFPPISANLQLRKEDAEREIEH
jgi:hypothetical protein